HCNAGFPVVDESSELLVPSRATTTDYGVPVEGYDTMSAPVRDATEACFEHELIAEPEGTVPAALVNRGLALGVYQVFRISQLPYHTVWRMMGEGTYALAMEPSTNRAAGFPGAPTTGGRRTGWAPASGPTTTAPMAGPRASARSACPAAAPSRSWSSSRPCPRRWSARGSPGAGALTPGSWSSCSPRPV